MYAIRSYYVGENTLQDAAGKMSAISAPQLEWHFIGHLQSNKTKLVPGNFHWLHTLDSLKLARKLSDACNDTQRPLQVLLQVNIANDPRKHGLSPDATVQFAADLQQLELPGIILRGLMTIGHEHASPRITSYNVCYTKLLRLKVANLICWRTN